MYKLIIIVIINLTHYALNFQSLSARNFQFLKPHNRAVELPYLDGVLSAPVVLAARIRYYFLRHIINRFNPSVVVFNNGFII